jgi:hypothetical protein
MSGVALGVVDAQAVKGVNTIILGHALKLRLEDSSGQVLANAAFTLSWREIQGSKVTGQTDASGVLTQPIPNGAQTAQLTLTTPAWSVVVVLATFPAPPAVDGVSARLNNLNMTALPPSTPLSSADAHEVSLAAQRYKMLKAMDPAATIDQLAAPLQADHDTF